MTPAKTWVENQWNTGSLESQVSRENFVRAIQADALEYVMEHALVLSKTGLSRRDPDWIGLCEVICTELVRLRNITLNLPSDAPKAD